MAPLPSFGSPASDFATRSIPFSFPDVAAAGRGLAGASVTGVVPREPGRALGPALDNTAVALLAAKSKPRLIGRYLLCDPIAAGGMAQVHLGRLLGGEGFSRIVAIKQLLPHFAQDEEFVKMFLEEARLLSRIHHPHVVAPIDVVRLDAELFIVMEYVHGDALANLTKRADAPVPPRIACAIMSAVLFGLHAGHEACDEGGEPLQIVHGDVSPQNILVGADGLARVVDFGIAKAASRHHTTQNRELRGKLGYFTPEQLRLERTDRRSDVFTAGIVLWELLTGRRLFAGESPAALANEVLSSDILPPSRFVDTPRELDAIVSQALSLTPADRYATAQQMADELCAALTPATPALVQEWVQALAGAELARRAELVSELESLPLHELTLPALLAPSAQPRTRSSPPSAEPVATPISGATEILALRSSAAPARTAPQTGAPASSTIATRPTSKRWWPALLTASAVAVFAGVTLAPRLVHLRALNSAAPALPSVSGASPVANVAAPRPTLSANVALPSAKSQAASPAPHADAPDSSATRTARSTAPARRAAPRRRPATSAATADLREPARPASEPPPTRSERAKLMDQIRQSKKP